MQHFHFLPLSCLHIILNISSAHQETSRFRFKENNKVHQNIEYLEKKSILSVFLSKNILLFTFIMRCFPSRQKCSVIYKSGPKTSNLNCFLSLLYGCELRRLGRRVSAILININVQRSVIRKRKEKQLGQ